MPINSTILKPQEEILHAEEVKYIQGAGIPETRRKREGKNILEKNKVVEINKDNSLIILNISDLSFPTKRHRPKYWMQKGTHCFAASEKHHLVSTINIS